MSCHCYISTRTLSGGDEDVLLNPLNLLRSWKGKGQVLHHMSNHYCKILLEAAGCAALCRHRAATFKFSTRYGLSRAKQPGMSTVKHM